MKFSLTLLGALAALFGALHAQSNWAIKTMDFVVRKGDQALLVKNGEATPLEKELKLAAGLVITTNGVLQVAGRPDQKLAEGRRLTLDGFWLATDGMLYQFQPHYLFKEQVLYFVQEGAPRKVERDVAFSGGIVLGLDGRLLTPTGRVLRFQDGQGLNADGAPLHALDHVMMVDNKLVLQKDGSFVKVPELGSISMSDGTKISASGLVVSPTGQSLQLENGQRLTLDGPAMGAIQ